MQIRVLFFGILKDLAGKSSDSISLPENATLGDVLSHYEKVIPRLKDTEPSLAMSVNQVYAGRATKLKPGDEVALLPPVSGGTADGAGKRSPHAAIVRGAIETTSILQGIKQPEDGAAAVCIWTTRPMRRWRSSRWRSWPVERFPSSRFAMSPSSIAWDGLKSAKQ